MTRFNFDILYVIEVKKNNSILWLLDKALKNLHYCVTNLILLLN